ncbi:MAG: formate dehydrogenase subunit gamma [Acidobacteria bacterium]|nr:formate dehydrogenase subunit gamma [Acidobacteriota bacterium]
MTNPNPEIRIPRFDAYERVMHWMAALSFFYATLTGLALWSPKLYWMATMMGGGYHIRGSHPWVGVGFAVVMGVMARRWANGMRLDADDRIWLTRMHKYATHDHAALPPSGRFNAGQKMLFWAQLATTLALFVSGFVLWFPEWMPRSLRLLSIAAHPLAAIGSITSILVHVYMGTAAVPHSMRAMLRGYVLPEWARFHHPKWYKAWRASHHV